MPQMAPTMWLLLFFIFFFSFLMFNMLNYFYFLKNSKHLENFTEKKNYKFLIWKW